MTCPLCGGRVIVLLHVICSRCRKAWHPFEFESLWIRKDTESSAWGNARPSVGECCGCRRAPVERFRFNIIIEDAFTRQAHTQLLCRICTQELLRTLIGQSVELTPQAELHRLDSLQGDTGWSMGQVA